MWKFCKKKLDFLFPAGRYNMVLPMYPRKSNLLAMKLVKNVSSPQNVQTKLAIMSSFTTRGAVFTAGMRSNHSQQVLPACG